LGTSVDSTQSRQSDQRLTTEQASDGTPHVAVDGGALRGSTVRFVGHLVHARRVNPAIVEIEQRADRDGEVERVIRPAGGAGDVEIAFGDRRRLVIHLVDESEQRLVLFVER
jgi:hypothetical protein